MLRVFILAFAFGAIVSCAPSAGPETRAAVDAANLDAALSGRTAGPAVSCVDQRLLGSNKSYGEGAILFEGATGSVVYVNRPRGGCPPLSTGRALRTRTTSGRLCRNDIVSVFDPVSGFEYGSCGLGDFTPYRR